MRFRAHEWLADHVSYIQYPQVKRGPKLPFFKVGMPWEYRLMLVIFGIALLAIGVIGVSVGVFVLFEIIKA